MFHPVEIKDPETRTINHCGEQWLHNVKATLFKYTSTSSENMTADAALECKNLGQNLHNYNDDLLFKNGKANRVKTNIKMVKFQHHPELIVFTKDSTPIIVEANPHDKRWVINLDIKD